MIIQQVTLQPNNEHTNIFSKKRKRWQFRQSPDNNGDKLGLALKTNNFPRLNAWDVQIDHPEVFSLVEPLDQFFSTEKHCFALLHWHPGPRSKIFFQNCMSIASENNRKHFFQVCIKFVQQLRLQIALRCVLVLTNLLNGWEPLICIALYLLSQASWRARHAEITGHKTQGG